MSAADKWFEENRVELAEKARYATGGDCPVCLEKPGKLYATYAGSIWMRCSKDKTHLIRCFTDAEIEAMDSVSAG